MRLFAIAALLAVAVLGAGCSGCQSPALRNDRGLLEGQATDEKALYAAEAAFYGANAAAEAAVDVGLVEPGSARALKVADLLDRGYDALKAGRAAHRVGDARSYAEKLGAAQDFIAAAWALLLQANSSES